MLQMIRGVIAHRSGRSGL